MRLRTISVLFFLPFLVLAACRLKSKPKEGARVVAVAVTKVEHQTVSFPIRVTGQTACDRTMRLSFKTGGYLLFLAEEGAVRRGEVLAQLDTTEIAAQVRQARQAFEKTQRDYHRASTLYEGGGAAREQLQNAETALNVAAAALQAAEFNLIHSTIRAPENGWVLKRLAEAGELIGPGIPVIYFGSGSVRLVQAALADRDILRIGIGDSAEIVFDALPGIRCTGRVTKVSPMVDPQTGLWDIQVTLVKPPVSLPVGLTAQISLFPASKGAAAVVPLEAVVEADGDHGAVFTVEGAAARRIPVTLGPIFGDRIVVTDGLRNVERVVTLGAGLLRDGDPVRLIQSTNQ
ncbi:MAG: efflux RND transporter periplasmic adaptor subunit [candidate division KSB1 bacterium]|nr:efflux RND transporter periplasmic adaptor subunit [candidate division KSB1 bacterium]